MQMKTSILAMTIGLLMGGIASAQEPIKIKIGVLNDLSGIYAVNRAGISGGSHS